MKKFFLLIFAVIGISLYAQNSLLNSGPMVGYGQMTEVMLWVQTTKPAAVYYRYWESGDPKNKMASTVENTKEENAFTAHTLIQGLKPGKQFEYEILVNGKIEKRSYPLRFQTQPLWQWRTDPPAFAVAFGSCAYINEPEADRPGKSYGADFEIFSSIASKNPDLMLWLGDNVYYRELDYNTVGGLRHRMTHDRALPELQALFGATHNYAMWDDHDFGPNDADRSYRLKEASLETFKMFWANQTYGTAKLPGVFQRFEWGDVEFFMLDDRYHRSPNESPDDSNKTMFGKAQVQWLKDVLVNSTATFKIIANGNQMLNLAGDKYESLAEFPFEHRDLLHYIKQQKISGILFLSGDRHMTELLQVPDSSFYTLYDYTSSSLTAGIANFTNEAELKMRVPGTFIAEHNFGMLRFSGPRKDRKLTLECYDVKGILRWSKDIRASELKSK